MKHNLSQIDSKINKKSIFINKDNLSYNYNLIQRHVSKSRVISVIKGDGYGHGLLECCKILKKSNCNDFYVARLDDALKLRENHKNINIYLLSGMIKKNDVKEIESKKIIPIINSPEQLDIIETSSKKLNYVLHIDTGMNRLGFQIKNIEETINKINFKRIKFVMSHFSSADDINKNECNNQLKNLLKFKKIFNKPLSIANSAGIFLNRKYHLDFVRPGKSLYGINPFNKKNYKLKQVMSIFAPILQVTDLKKSQTIGYSQTFKTNKKIKIATIDFGYSDGYLRSGSNRGKVFIDGIPCKILGRVSMDLITIDVSKVPMKKLYLGKPVEIIGINQSYENIAYDTETNEHEILISLGRNLSRVYF